MQETLRWTPIGRWTGLAIAAGLAVSLGDAATAHSGDVEILRDRWGVPHIIADTDEGAMYGLGYATAADRGFQMEFVRRIMQGRLAETIGAEERTRRPRTTIDQDRWQRTLGWQRSAERIVAALDDDSRAMLTAYAAGVNDYRATHRDDRHPLFDQLEIEPEPWTPADCLVAWWHLAQFFATDGTRDLIALRSATNRRSGRPAAAVEPDESAAVIQRSDVDDDWITDVHTFLRSYGYGAEHAPAEGAGEEGPKFSHAWVVGGKRSTTGSTLLVSMPQTVVANPPLLYEFHIHGRTFNARGVGVPGSPIILIGFTPDVAWGMTALGADQADLFLLETEAGRPQQYRLDGEWRAMDVRSESIRVKGGEPVDLVVRETVWGPIVTEFAFARPEDGEAALKRAPLCDTDCDTIQGALAMMRATSAAEFDAAMAGWRFPSANVVFGDRAGDIGYRTAGAFPLRSPVSPGQGRMAQRGDETRFDWAAFVPHRLAPHVSNPDHGVLFSANHRPIGDFYPIMLGNSTGSLGDTVRSWRLRERLDVDGAFSPADVRAIADDEVNPARRDIVRLGLHVASAQPDVLSTDALEALLWLDPWRREGSRSNWTSPGAALALEINTMFRIVTTPLAARYGGGETGLSRFLRSVGGRLDADPDALLTDDEAMYVNDVLTSAWRSAVDRYGDDPTTWNATGRRAAQQTAAYYQGLDGFPSLDEKEDLRRPALACTDPGTLRSQGAQAYLQFVRLDDVDRSESLLPPGNVERPDDPLRTAMQDAWAAGTWRPAPLSTSAVEAITIDRVRLTWPVVDDQQDDE